MNGGAIALGHPLDKSFLSFHLEGVVDMYTIRCTGTRQIVSGLNELRRRRGKVELYLTWFKLFIPNIYFCRFSSLQCVLGQEWVQQVFFCGNK